MMKLKRALYLAVFLLLPVFARAQVNTYIGGNLQGNYSWIRGDTPVLQPGLGGGFSFIYWEFEYWFIKAGLDYNFASSTIKEYPDDFGVTPENQDEKINITFAEQTIGIPLTIYFRPIERGANTLLITGSLKTMGVVHLKESSDEFGEVVLKGDQIERRVKTSLGAGVGYQRQLEKHTFLNIIPSFNIDLRGDRAFNSITLTAELIFGIY
jgi:hypothetical protein